jgi:tricorn protease
MLWEAALVVAFANPVHPGTARPGTAHPGIAKRGAGQTGTAEAFLTRPDVHGNKIVFSAEGDLWLSDLATGESTRLTSDPGLESFPRFSPDGQTIAYTATYDGAPNIYLIPANGGLPKRLTYDAAGATCLGWTPDNKVLFRSRSKLSSSAVEQFATNELFTVPATGGRPTKVKVPRGQFASLSADGHSLAFVPYSNEWMNWFRYEAGEADKVWLADLSSGKFTQLTNSKGVDTQPVWAGGQIYFVSERTGVRNLYRLDPASKRTQQITFSTEAPVRWPSSDGRKVVFEMGPRLGVYDIASNAVSTIPVHLNSDRIHARSFEAPIAPTDGVALGPTGKRVAFASRGHLVTVPVGDGSIRELAGASGQRIEGPAWSPDGKQVTYISDANGEQELYLVDARGAADAKVLTSGLHGQNGRPRWSPDGKYLALGNRAGDIKLVDAKTGAIKLVGHDQGPLEYDQIQTTFAFSPDSKWVAFAQSRGTDIPVTQLYEIATGKTTAVTDPDVASISTAFSPDGKFLYVLEARAIDFGEQFNGHIKLDAHTQVTAFALDPTAASPFLEKNEDEPDGTAKPPSKPAPVKVDLAGLQSRSFDMQVPPGDYFELYTAGGKLLLQNARGGVMAFDIASKKLDTLAPGALGDISPDGHKLLVRGPGGLQVYDTMGAPPSPVNTKGATVTVNPTAEWRQILEESWRLGRDLFYDPNHHGVDWDAVRTRYRAQLPLVGSRDDLTRLVGDMISELNTGHCYVGGPTSFMPRANRQGLLGIDLEWDAANRAYKITHILRGDSWHLGLRSPLAQVGAGVKEGDYLLKIAGKPLVAGQDPDALLVGTLGRQLTITFNSSASSVGAKDLTVTPITTGDESELRLIDWVESRRAYVKRVAGDQIGYVYVSDMTAQGATQFAERYYANVNKPGILVDVRGNGGGFISGNLLNDLSTRITGFFSFRAGGNFRREGWAPLGHVAALTNEYAFSDGEYFSEFFKRLKIGPLVGHRTGGGEVGSGNGYPMIDGGALYIPNYGAWVQGSAPGKGEWIVEGRGAVPDYEVDQDPAALMAGKDPQLDKALELLLDEIKRHPVNAPQHPPFPVKRGGSRNGS